MLQRAGTLCHASTSRLQPPSWMPSTQETICGREGLPGWSRCYPSRKNVRARPSRGADKLCLRYLDEAA